MKNMMYICPKCNYTMHAISTRSIPSQKFYKCFSCGYKSIVVKEEKEYVVLPEYLRPEEHDDDIS